MTILRGLEYNWLNMQETRRSAQDDEFVGGLEYNWLNMQKTRKDRKSHRLFDSAP